MPRKKRRLTAVSLSFAFVIIITFFMSLGLWSDESSIIDWLKYLMTKEGDEITDTGAELSETIGEGIKDPEIGDEITDTSADLDGAIREDNPGAAVADTSDEVIDAGAENAGSDDPGTDDAPDPGDASEPEPEPEPEPDAGIDFFEHFNQGTGFIAYKYNSIGNTARGTTNADPYMFVKVASCGMRVDIRTMPTAAFPGTTAKEGLTTIFQTDYLDKTPSSESYEIIKEPYDLVLNGAPAARLEAWHTTSRSTYLFQLTAVRGETRSGTVKGQMLASCAEKPSSVEYMNEMTDSVVFFEPHPVCHVGHMPDSDPAQYGVGCDDLAYKFVGIDALADEGFTDIVLGPVTWDECAAFMRENNQENW